MTQNQIEYWKLKEVQRHNAMEEAIIPSQISLNEANRTKSLADATRSMEEAKRTRELLPYEKMNAQANFDLTVAKTGTEGENMNLTAAKVETEKANTAYVQANTAYVTEHAGLTSKQAEHQSLENTLFRQTYQVDKKEVAEMRQSAAIWDARHEAYDSFFDIVNPFTYLDGLENVMSLGLKSTGSSSGSGSTTIKTVNDYRTYNTNKNYYH